MTDNPDREQMAKKTAESPEPNNHTPDRESVGSFVRRRRQAAGLTQRMLAELVGTGTRMISELENDKPTLRMDSVQTVLAAFGKRLGMVDLTAEERQTT